MKPANNAPIYAAAIYTDMAELFRGFGYALAVHGSVARDFDLIAVPWADEIASIDTVLDRIRKTFHIELITGPVAKNYGRVCYTVVIGFGTCMVDLSFIGVPKSVPQYALMFERNV